MTGGGRKSFLKARFDRYFFVLLPPQSSPRLEGAAA